MVCNDSNVWKLVEHLRKHYSRHSHTRFVRPTEHQRYVEAGFFLRRIIGKDRCLERMQPNWKTIAIGDSLEDWEEFFLRVMVREINALRLLGIAVLVLGLVITQIANKPEHSLPL